MLTNRQPVVQLHLNGERQEREGEREGGREGEKEVGGMKRGRGGERGAMIKVGGQFSKGRRRRRRRKRRRTFRLHPLRLSETRYFPCGLIIGSPLRFWG